METVEKIDEFQEWLNRTCRDATTKLELSDRTVAFILLSKGLDHHVRAIAKEQLMERPK